MVLLASSAPIPHTKSLQLIERPDYYSSVQGVVFVVDASNLLRLGVVKREFRMFIDHRSIQTSRSEGCAGNGMLPGSRRCLS